MLRWYFLPDIQLKMICSLTLSIYQYNVCVHTRYKHDKIISSSYNNRMISLNVSASLHASVCWARAHTHGDRGEMCAIKTNHQQLSYDLAASAVAVVCEYECLRVLMSVSTLRGEMNKLIIIDVPHIVHIVCVRCFKWYGLASHLLLILYDHLYSIDTYNFWSHTLVRNASYLNALGAIFTNENSWWAIANDSERLKIQPTNAQLLKLAE